MYQYLFDTNIASYLAKGLNARLAARVDGLPADSFAISTITEAEMRFGAELLPPEAKVRRIVASFLEDIEILPWDSTCAKTYALLAARQRHIGKTLSAADTMIAAHALAHSLTLISNDHAFEQVEGLRLEDWTEEPSNA